MSAWNKNFPTKTGKSSNKSPKTSDKFVETFEKKADSLQANQETLEKKYKEHFLFHIDRIKREEKEIYSRDKREAELEIKALQKEVGSLAQQTDQLEKHLQTAAKQTIVNPNIYDLSFLQQLRSFIKHFRAKIEDASIWLATLNQKSRKRSNFWNMFANKKGGAKFLLSSEHYLTRSAG